MTICESCKFNQECQIPCRDNKDECNWYTPVSDIEAIKAFNTILRYCKGHFNEPCSGCPLSVLHKNVAQTVFAVPYLWEEIEEAENELCKKDETKRLE